MPRLARFICIVTVLSAIAVTPSLAEAKKRVVVLPFSGGGGSSARAGFVSAIKRRFQVISASRSQRRGGIRKMCRRLRCSAVVRGRVKGRRRKRLVVTIYDASGRSVGRRASSVRGRRRLRRAGAAIGRKSMGLLGRRKTVRRARPAPAPAPRPAPVAQPAKPAADEPLMASGEPRAAKKRRRRRDRDDEDDEDLEDDDNDSDNDNDSDSDDVAAGRGKSGQSLVDVFAAFGMASRTYELVDPQGTEVGKYGGAYYPEFLVGVEFYPMTLMTGGWLSAFGLGVTYSRHISISTEVKGSGAAVDTSTQEIQANLRYRWLIKDKLRGPQVFGYVGWGYRAFDLAENTILASFGYHSINLGVGGRMPLGTPYVGVSLEASIRPVLKVGMEAVNSYGEKGGAFAWSVKPGIYGYVWKLRYFAEFEFVSYTMDFKGLAPSSDPGPLDLEVASDGSDTFLRTWIGIGYSY
ncbi:MAG: hypothetical protein JRH20_10810 [Deltaproteobacteria bacterium]|nr:hypothetical protein [Deltaproteobacteria bacterium]